MVGSLILTHSVRMGPLRVHVGLSVNKMLFLCRGLLTRTAQCRIGPHVIVTTLQTRAMQHVLFIHDSHQLPRVQQANVSY